MHTEIENAMRTWATVDGNEACSRVAYQFSDVIAIYPITPSSGMGEAADAWAATQTPNLWGSVPTVVEMQSEGGAAGAIHGALQAGTLATTFTASQGLLLMIPNMYKIAGELTPAVFHVSARAVASHALSIFGDHSDVMAARSTGFAMLSSRSVQEAQDLAVIAHASTLESRIPFLHFFDGFRTSHEINKIELVDDVTLRAMIDDRLVAAHRARALTPDRPVVRGTAQNPDVFFQNREAVNRYYASTPGIVARVMERFARLTGRSYRPFRYHGAPDAERIIVVMGSASETVEAVVDALGPAAKVGVLTVHLFRPFSTSDFLAALPPTVRALAVLDRTKEPGAIGEPLYQDVATAVMEGMAEGTASFPGMPVILGGRYGLGSKEFTPPMAKAVFDELAKARPRRRFTVGIVDDVTGLSLAPDESCDLEPEGVRAIFFGLGSDGTVGANKNTIKIIGEETSHSAQAYFVYDSKKSGAVTISHLRFGPRPIHAPYLISRASLVACHQFNFLGRYDVLDLAEPGGVFLLNAPYAAGDVWDHLPSSIQRQIVDKRLNFYVIDAYDVAREAGMGGRINTIMQTCFFAISGVLPRDEAIQRIKHAIEKTYGRKGADTVQRNCAAVDMTLARLEPVTVPQTLAAVATSKPAAPPRAPTFVRQVTAEMLANHGDRLPVSAFPADGTWPVGTSRWEKRNLAADIPVWDEALCIQCNKCALVCPHAAIRVKVYAPELLQGAPDTFKSVPFKGPDLSGSYTVQVAPEDCTGCTLCVAVCPAKDRVDTTRRALEMVPQAPLRDAERCNYEFFLHLPEADRTVVRRDVKSSQFLEPLFEYSGACAGCGETPYIKLVTQLFGDRTIIANATGCSSIYGANLPTTPYTADAQGRGPAWANSLFEDNAEFGLGIRLGVDQLEGRARELLKLFAGVLPADMVSALLSRQQTSEAEIAAQRRDVAGLKKRLAELPAARELVALADYLVRKTIWIVGGDGWAYDIGYGGLDHVLATGANVNVLVLDTEVYSNTGGQQSKATPTGAAAKFAAAGKSGAKKDLGLMAMAYGHVYVAQVAMGAKDSQTLKALVEAESYPGPSLVIAYSHCIAHGYDMGDGLRHQKLAVDSGYWPLYRFDPRRAAAGEHALVVDSAHPTADVTRLLDGEARFQSTAQQYPERFQRLSETLHQQITRRLALYDELAKH
jgi:pyruvate-ferredoxin/flavodoxin oxidoreductase